MDLRPAVALLLVAAALAGCAAPSDPSATATTPASTTGSLGGGAGGPSRNGTQAAAPAIHARTLYFTTDGSLDLRLPPAGSVPLTFPPTVLATGFSPAEFASDPFARPAQVAADVQATLWVEADAPMPSNQQFDVGIWVGGTRSTPLFAAATLPAPAVAPGAPIRFDLRLPFGTLAPVVLAAGDTLTATLILGGDYGAGTSRLLVGGEHASQLNLTFQDLAVDPLGARDPPTQKTHEGTLQAIGGGPTCAFQGNVFTAPVQARANLTYIEARVEGSGAAATDLDLSLLDGDRVLSAGTTPRGKESVFLAGPAAKEFSGKELTLRVVACSGGQVTFTATVRQA